MGWYGILGCGPIPWDGMGSDYQIPYQSHSKWYGILCSPSGKLSLFRQCASYIRLSLLLGPCAVPYLLDGMVCTPRGPIPIPSHGTVGIGYPMGYPISFRPLGVCVWNNNDGWAS